MQKKFSDMIKELRRSRGLTQEQMAEALNISSQAVSKWETGGSYPDISLLTIIADYFGCSVDYLLCHDTSHEMEEIKAICREAEKLCDHRDALAAVVLLRTALLKHPGNEELMYQLAWALSGTLRESPENYEEAILLYHKILAVSTDTEMRNRVTRDLVYRYYTKGDIARALEFANSLPEFDVCREYVLGRSNVLQGRELSEYLQKNILRFGNSVAECLEYFITSGVLDEDEKAPLTTDIAKEKLAMLKKVLDF